MTRLGQHAAMFAGILTGEKGIVWPTIAYKIGPQMQDPLLALWRNTSSLRELQRQLQGHIARGATPPPELEKLVVRTQRAQLDDMRRCTEAGVPPRFIMFFGK